MPVERCKLLKIIAVNDLCCHKMSLHSGSTHPHHRLGVHDNLVVSMLDCQPRGRGFSYPQEDNAMGSNGLSRIVVYHHAGALLVCMYNG